MINDSDIPLIGQPQDGQPEPPPLPGPTDHVRFLGETTIESLPPMDLITLGVTDTSRMEFYLGDYARDYYVRFLPHHELMEIGWKNQWKVTKEGDPFPEVPHGCVYTDKGFMYSVERFNDRQHEHLYDVLYDEILNKLDLFAASKALRAEDPWG